MNNDEFFNDLSDSKGPNELSVNNLVGLRAHLIQPLSENSLIETLKKIKEEFPKAQEKFNRLAAWKGEYDKAGFSWFGLKHEYTGRALEEKKEELLFSMAETTNLQIDSLNLILCLTTMIGEQQCQIQKQQHILQSQQEKLECQQNKISFQQVELQDHQEQLYKQNVELKSTQEVLKDNNNKLLESAEVLKSLRQLGEDHDNDIFKIKTEGDAAMSGLERAMIQVMLISQDLKLAMKKANNQEHVFGVFCKQTQQEMKDTKESCEMKIFEINNRVTQAQDSIRQENEQQIFEFANGLKRAVQNVQWNA